MQGIIKNLRIFVINLLTLLTANTLLSQSQEWIVFNDKGKNIKCISGEGTYLWIGTGGGGVG